MAALEDVNIRRQFQKIGVDIDEVSRRIRKELGSGRGTPAGQVPMSLDARRAIEAANTEAARLGHATVEAPHLLLGILEDATGSMARFLVSSGADLSKLSKNLRDMMSKGEFSQAFYDGRKAVEQPGIDKTAGIVKDLGRDLTADAEAGKFDPIIGREEEILAMIRILTGRRKNNPILVGDAGVGKTAVVEGLAQVIVSPGVLPELRGKRIRTVEMVAVIAGATLVGQFEQKLQGLIKEAEADPDLILFIDEIHTLMGMRGAVATSCASRKCGNQTASSDSASTSCERTRGR